MYEKCRTHVSSIYNKINQMNNENSKILIYINVQISKKILEDALN